MRPAIIAYEVSTGDNTDVCPYTRPYAIVLTNHPNALFSLNTLSDKTMNPYLGLDRYS